MYQIEEKFPVTEGGVCAAGGFKASGVYAGIKAFMHTGNDGNESPLPGQKNDIALVLCDVLCNTAGVYTSNKVKGAPVWVTKDNLAKTGGKAQAVIVNSGNANTCNGDGEEKARAMCALVAEKAGIKTEEVIVASTGVIGQVLPLRPIEKAIGPLYEKLSYTGNLEAATAIMTTDTVKKEYAVTFTAGGKECHLGGMAKGSGMIEPNMATTLNFITTDCALSSEMLQKALSETVQVTYNCLCVDGDQSTNDMCMLMSSGLAGNEEISSEGEDFDTFREALFQVMANLTRMLAKDGEGATKLVTCVIGGAPDRKTAAVIAKSVIRSPLVKCAMYGADANCGRILCAMGYADTDCDVTKADVYYESAAGRILVCENGLGLSFDEDKAKEILSEKEVEIFADLHMGSASSVAWGCDMTYDYVKINGDYRS
ncbi:MAG: bifunctional glutamate N-acetyltransferase/amino-acid acetyltransferase ArgJ [Oscillospiraceae bacterium]|nr:bifunctional glutamate N-acetyltransferase/amino-acid acetyltransferase ArgJ [Oscillospiraceae bacterium]